MRYIFICLFIFCNILISAQEKSLNKIAIIGTSHNGNKMMNGTERKLVDCTLAKKYGWKPKFLFSRGFKITYQDFLENKKKYLGM